MPRNFLIVFLALLIIIPTVAFAYKFLSDRSLLVKPPAPTQQTAPKATAGAQKTAPNLTADESFVLSNILESKETEKEKNVFQIALSKAAVEGDQLNISSCSPKPVVLNLKGRKDFIVKNDDALTHTLTIYATKYSVPAKGNITIAIADFGQSGHVYPYSCDDVSIAGVFWLPLQK